MEKFIVIVPAVVAAPAAGDYRIVPEAAPPDPNYKKVYGSDTKENCQKWIDGKTAAASAAPFAAPPEQSPKRGFWGYVSTGWSSYLLITAGLFGLMFVTVELGKLMVLQRAESLTPKLELKQSPAECAFLTTPAQKTFVAAQRAELVDYAKSHRATAIEFYKNFYNTYIVFSLFGLFAAISLAVIVRTGIDEASPHLITVFLVSTGIVLAHQGFFGVFQQKANIDNNAKLFVGYAQLNTRIDTYCATGTIPMVDPKILLVQSLSKETPTPTPGTNAPNPNSNTTASNQAVSDPAANQASAASNTVAAAKNPAFSVALSPDEFIGYIGWQMEQLKAISIAIDDKQVVAIDGNKLMITQP